eukprot:GHVN01025266.1.p1 GENE.GHVN01025266.1~~GHVN01025266.1.p1  ORF type:complete len:306 (-),score=107.69 GHVN01025266.1:211-1128(-)
MSLGYNTLPSTPNTNQSFPPLPFPSPSFSEPSGFIQNPQPVKASQSPQQTDLTQSPQQTDFTQSPPERDPLHYLSDRAGDGGGGMPLLERSGTLDTWVSRSPTPGTLHSGSLTPTTPRPGESNDPVADALNQQYEAHHSPHSPGEAGVSGSPFFGPGFFISESRDPLSPLNGGQESDAGTGRLNQKRGTSAELWPSPHLNQPKRTGEGRRRASVDMGRVGVKWDNDDDDMSMTGGTTPGRDSQVRSSSTPPSPGTPSSTLSKKEMKKQSKREQFLKEMEEREKKKILKAEKKKKKKKRKKEFGPR